ncbi:TPA: hypothetical protein HA251_01075 [Candidatus Woesearchaeota archaeon]|nr:hypothetical protein [Candidatus Woesearchaeota archaeon]
MKRGEISMEVIIIAAIALLVLVILSVLVIRSGGNVAKECLNIGGECRSGSSPTDCPIDEGLVYSPNNCNTGQVCCIKLTNPDE